MIDIEKEKKFFFCVPSYSSGIHRFWSVLRMWPCFFVLFFKSNHRGSNILSSWRVHAECVFVAGIHPPGTLTSGSFVSVRWNASVHRLDLGVYSHPQEFFGNGVRTHVNSKGKFPLPEAQRRVEPATLHDAVQPAQHTTD